MRYSTIHSSFLSCLLLSQSELNSLWFIRSFYISIKNSFKCILEIRLHIIGIFWRRATIECRLPKFVIGGCSFPLEKNRRRGVCFLPVKYLTPFPNISSTLSSKPEYRQHRISTSLHCIIASNQAIRTIGQKSQVTNHALLSSLTRNDLCHSSCNSILRSNRVFKLPISNVRKSAEWLPKYCPRRTVSIAISPLRLYSYKLLSIYLTCNI